MSSRLPSRLPSYIEGIPSGVICMWHGLIANIPSGWLLCDGTNGTPDLRAKFVRGAPAATQPGGTGGSDTVALTTAQLAKHTHTINMGSTTGGSLTAAKTSDGTISGTQTSSSTGSGTAHENRPAYYQVLFIMKS